MLDKEKNTMDLTRRGFLQMVGLGGVALTIPKPLKVVAAKMADLERPPLHVGTTEIGPLDMFTMHRFALNIGRLTTCKDAFSFSENWIFSMTFRDREGKLERTNFVNMPVAFALFTPLDSGFSGCMETEESIELLRFEPPVGCRISSGEIIEAWLVPAPPGPGEEKPRPPLRPMPETTLTVDGILEREGRTFLHTVTSNFSKVRLERTRAIELGLVEPEEEEETWQNLAKR